MITSWVDYWTHQGEKILLFVSDMKRKCDVYSQSDQLSDKDEFFLLPDFTLSVSKMLGRTYNSVGIYFWDGVEK